MRSVTLLVAMCACHRPPPAMPARGGELIVELGAPGMTAQELSPVATELEARLATTTGIAALEGIIRDGTIREVIQPSGTLDALDSAVQPVLADATRSLPPGLTPPRRWQRGYPTGSYVVAAPTADALGVGVRGLHAALGGVGGIAVETCGEPVARRVVELDPARLASAGKSVADIVAAFGATPAGTLPAGIEDVATVREDTAPPACSAIDAGGARVAIVEIAVFDPTQLSATATSVAQAVSGVRASLPAGVTITELPRVTPTSLALSTDDNVAALTALHAAAPAALVEAGLIGDHVRSARIYGAAPDALGSLPGVAGAGVVRGELVLESADAASLAAAAKQIAAERHDIVAVRGTDERPVDRVTVARGALPGDLMRIASSLETGAPIGNGVVLVAHGHDVPITAGVRLDAVATFQRETTAVEIVHVNGVRAAIVLVAGDPTSTKAPTGVRMEVRAQ